MVPLSSVEKGRRVKIVKIDAGPGLVKRLIDLGFVPDAEVEVVSGCKTVLVSVKGVRLVLGYGIARRILVQ